MDGDERDHLEVLLDTAKKRHGKAVEFAWCNTLEACGCDLAKAIRWAEARLGRR